MTSNDDYRFVYQEWDVMRERHVQPEEKLEKLPPVSHRQLSFALQLQEARIRNRLTIQELAARCNLPIRTLSLFENGTEVPPADIAISIKKELNIEQ